MKKLAISATVLIGLATGQAHAVGCFTGALAGGAAGHLANHGILGALAGCVAGHTWKKHTLRKQDLQNRQAYQQRQDYYNRNPNAR
jgi:outer membrane lipoprotein SlyB